MKKIVLESMVWGLLTVTVIAMLNIAGMFPTDFRKHESQFSSQLIQESEAGFGKIKTQVYSIKNTSELDWNYLHYAIIVRDGSKVIYSKYSVEPSWKVDANSEANISVEIPVLGGNVHSELVIGNLREKSIFRI